MTLSNATPDVTAHPAVIIAAVVISIAVMVSVATPRVMGNIGEAIHAWAKRQRTAASEADDADIADLRRERDYLRGVADERLREIKARDQLAAAHAPWDWERYEAAIRAGHAVTHPPPLIPDVPPPPRQEAE